MTDDPIDGRSADPFRLGDFEVRPSEGEISHAGQVVRVDLKAMAVLVCLAARAGRVTPKEEILRVVWPDATVEEVALARAISELRRALGDDAHQPSYIETLHRRGYRLLVPVQGRREERTFTSRRLTGLGLGAGLLGLAALASVVAWTVLRPTPGPGIDSVAVLPLKNFSDAGQEYFADGMTEALITDLAKIRSLRVISRTSVMHYKASSKTLPEIARELNVGAIVEGSVRRVGDRVRITAQLVDAATDQHLWAEYYDGDLRDVLKLQNDVARSIAREIEVRLTAHEEASLATAGRVNPRAYELHLKGRFQWNERTEDRVRKAIAYFEQSIAEDPAYAPAYAGLADAYLLLGCCGYDALPPREAMPRARAAATRAVELDPALAEAHTSLAWLKFAFDWDWPAAREQFERAIELNPSNANAHHWYAVYLSALGRYDDALTQIERARQLDPLSPIIQTSVGWVHYLGRRFDRAIRVYLQTIGANPDFPATRWQLGATYAAKGMYPEAIHEFERHAALSGASAYALAGLGYAHARAGDRTEALRVLDSLTAMAKSRYVPAIDFAFVYAGLGERDQAFAALEEAYEARQSYLILLRVAPLFDPLRSDSRFPDLMGRMKLSNSPD